MLQNPLFFGLVYKFKEPADFTGCIFNKFVSTLCGIGTSSFRH